MAAGATNPRLEGVYGSRIVAFFQRGMTEWAVGIHVQGDDMVDAVEGAEYWG